MSSPISASFPEASAVRASVAHGSARLLYVHADAVLAELKRRHHIDDEAVQLAGELVVANLLLAAWVKGEERISLQARLSEPEASFFGEADASGVFRGRFGASPVLPAAFQRRRTGDMLVIRYDVEHEIYRGGTRFFRKSIEDALHTHLRQSEQVDAVARLMVDGDSAWGVMVERMPGDAARAAMDDQHWAAWSAIIGVMPAFEMADDLAAGELASEAVEVLETVPLVFMCRCSEARVHEMLVALGADELGRMIEEDGGAEVTCHFCNTARQVDATVLAGLRDIARGAVGES